MNNTDKHTFNTVLLIKEHLAKIADLFAEINTLNRMVQERSEEANKYASTEKNTNAVRDCLARYSLALAMLRGVLNSFELQTEEFHITAIKAIQDDMMVGPKQVA